MDKKINLAFHKRGKQIEVKDAFAVGESATEHLEALGFLLGNLDFEQVCRFTLRKSAD